MKRVVNSSRSTELASHVAQAKSLHERMVGLLSKSHLEQGEGLWISPCASIHTFFMRFSIDVCFLDHNHRILKLYHSMPSFRVSAWVFGAVGVLELPAGVLKKTQTLQHDILHWENA